jgi:hypothetical protein
MRGGHEGARALARLRLAHRAKRAGDYDAAVALWQEAADAGEAQAFRELAIHHEHRTRDVALALRAAAQGLRLALARDDPRSRRMADGFRHRQQRLEARMGARPARDEDGTQDLVR